MKYICLGYYDKNKFEALAEASEAPCSTRVLTTTTIFATTDIGPVERPFNLRKPP